MRIALLASAASLHTRRWATWLASTGHEVRVFSDVAAPAGVGLGGAQRIAPRWTRWQKLVSFKLVGGRYANSRDKWRAYAADLRAFAPDIVHAMEAVSYGPSLVHFPLQARVLTPWGRDIESLAWPDLDPERRRLVLAGCAAADAITTNGPGLENRWAALMGVSRQRLHFFPWGFDPAVFRPTGNDAQQALRAALGLPADARLVVSPRRADPYYGIGELLDAWRSLDADARLVILRGGVGDTHWQAVAAAAGSAHRVHLVEPMLAPHQMATLLGAAHAVVLAPRTDLLACTLLESMACGALPVVAPNPAYRTAVAPIDEQPWPADRGVGLVARGHAAGDLASALARALETDAGERRAIAEHNVQAMVAGFTWDHHAPRLLEVYETARARLGERAGQ